LHGHTLIGGSMSVKSPTANLPSVFFLMHRSHQTFGPVSAAKLMEFLTEFLTELDVGPPIFTLL
jgi:hypothetical protein